MDQAVRHVYNILCAQYELQCRLLELSRRKTKLIMDANIKELEKLLSLEEQIVAKMGKMENERQHAVQKYIAQLDKPVEEDNISAIICNLRDNEAQMFKQLKQKFAEVIEQQKQVNQKNTMLIKDNLDYLKFITNLITQNEQPIYGTKNKQTINLFDKQV